MAHTAQRGQDIPDLSVVFERLAANDRAIVTMSNQVTQIATQVSALAGTTQVLANTDGAFKQQIDSQGAQLQQLQQRLFEIVQQLGEMKASVKQTITDALKETVTIERRADDGRFTDAARIQQWLVTALIAILCAVLTYLFTHPIH